jgi:cob(I)alamin adenosyltransferase
MVRINRVTTKRGDDGSTDLASGERVPKDSARIEAYGAVDEANAAIGLARELLAAKPAGEPRASIEALLLRVQNELFNLGSELATTAEKIRPNQPVIEPRHVEALEEATTTWNEDLPDLKSFILPGGGVLGAALHVARTVTRRAERAALHLSREAPVGKSALLYLNRLSDLLFVLGRAVSHAYGEPEPLWKPEST